HPLHLGLLARHLSARVVRQHRGTQARRHHPRHGIAGRYRQNREGCQWRSHRRVRRARDGPGRRTDLVSPSGGIHARGSAAHLAAICAAYHAFGTTSVFEGHGASTELLRTYKQAHREGALTMRTSLAFSPNWQAAGAAPIGPFVEAWAGWLGEP